MHKFKRPRIRLLFPEPGSDKPLPSPPPIDEEIARNNGKSVAIEATNERLQASKTITTPSLSEIIKYQNRETDQLQRKLAYMQRKQALDTYLVQRGTQAKEVLEEAIIEYQRLLAIIKYEYGIPQ
jgi:hypothetical protein